MMSRKRDATLAGVRGSPKSIGALGSRRGQTAALIASSVLMNGHGQGNSTPCSGRRSNPTSRQARLHLRNRCSVISDRLSVRSATRQSDTSAALRDRSTRSCVDASKLPCNGLQWTQTAADKATSERCLTRRVRKVATCTEDTHFGTIDVSASLRPMGQCIAVPLMETASGETWRIRGVAPGKRWARQDKERHQGVPREKCRAGCPVAAMRFARAHPVRQGEEVRRRHQGRDHGVQEVRRSSVHADRFVQACRWRRCYPRRVEGHAGRYSRPWLQVRRGKRTTARPCGRFGQNRISHWCQPCECAHASRGEQARE